MSLVFYFSITILTVIRLVGFGVGIDFYLGTRRHKFLAQVFGWSIFALAGVFHLLSFLSNDVVLKEIFFLLFGICTSVGVFLVSVSIMLYFRLTTKTNVSIIACVLAGLPVLLYILLSLNIAVSFSLFSAYLIVAGIYVLGVIEKEKFKKEVGASIKWFYAIVGVGMIQVLVIILLTIQGYSLGVYDVHTQDDMLLLINNTMSIAILVITVVLLIHLETSRSERYNYRMKDKYSHDLGNLIQVIVSGMQLVEAGQITDSEKRETIVLINQKCEEVAELIHEIRSL
jgi:hypothetical protein